MKKNNRVVIALQGLCLALVLVIQCTLTQVTIPTIEGTVYEEVHHLIYKAEAFTVLSLMLGLLIIVLEFCKEYKS
tara:strand:+ start:235 stop:459 length:225 start_codon:yes stop_codon:yes gene_type:complete